MTNPQPTNCHWCGTGCMTSHQFRDSSKASQLCCVPSKSDRLIQMRLHASSPACPPDGAQVNDRSAIHYLDAPANHWPEQQATCMVDKHEQWKGGGWTQQEMSGGGGGCLAGDISTTVTMLQHLSCFLLGNVINLNWWSNLNLLFVAHIPCCLFGPLRRLANVADQPDNAEWWQMQPILNMHYYGSCSRNQPE